MSCIGDRISGHDSEAQCYRLDACLGCSKCEIKCEPPCENCPVWAEKARTPEPGDYVVVQAPILTATYAGPKWTPAMDLAIGRVGWVANGTPVDGFKLKFQTTEKEILDAFRYPLEALRLAFPADRSIDKLIKTTKQGSVNEEM